MKTSGSHSRYPAGDVGSAGSSNQLPRAPKNKLEDLLNDLMSMEGGTLQSQGAESSTKEKTPEHSEPAKIAASNSATQRIDALPTEIAKALALPSNPEGVYHTLKSYQQTHRHKPLLEVAGGRVVYVEYSPETERIRLYIGQSKQLTIKPRGLSVSSGFFPVEIVFEFKLEFDKKEVFGISSSKERILQSSRKGSALLNSRESADQSLVAVLYFIVFHEKAAGISTSSVKAEHFHT